MKESKIRWLSISLFAIIALTLGLWLQTHGKKHSTFYSQYSTALPIAVPLKSFQLQDDQGKPFSNRHLLGHWSLIYFGYTHCPMLCPTMLNKLNEAYEIITQSSTRAPQVIFISIDTHRDNANSMRNYLNHFNKNFIGLIGAPTEIQSLTKSLGIAYMPSQEKNMKNDFDHSAIIIIVNPQGKWVGIMNSPPSGRDIARDFEGIQKTYAAK